jgi:hypothetical protein
MTENLRLVFSGNYVGKYDSSNNTITATTTQITPANSDVSATWLPNHTTETSGGTEWWTSQEESANNFSRESIDTPRSATTNQVVSTYDGESQRAGSFYNFYVTSASTGNYDVDTGSVPDSICPKGWALPVESNGDFLNLSLAKVFNTYGLNGTGIVSNEIKNKTLSFPVSLVLSGRRYRTAIEQIADRYSFVARRVYLYTANGSYMKNVANSTMSGSYKYDNNGWSRAQGNSIRCVVE